MRQARGLELVAKGEERLGGLGFVRQLCHRVEELPRATVFAVVPIVDDGALFAERLNLLFEGGVVVAPERGAERVMRFADIGKERRRLRVCGEHCMGFFVPQPMVRDGAHRRAG